MQAVREADLLGDALCELFISLRESNAFCLCRRWSLLFEGTVLSMQKRFFWPVCTLARPTDTISACRDMKLQRDRRRCIWRLHSTLRNAQRCDDESAHQKEILRMPCLHGMHLAVCLCLQVFLKYKADTEVENAEEETPLHVASYHGHSEVVKVRPQRAFYVAGREWRRFLSQLELTSVPTRKTAGLLST